MQLPILLSNQQISIGSQRQRPGASEIWLEGLLSKALLGLVPPSLGLGYDICLGAMGVTPRPKIWQIWIAIVLGDSYILLAKTDCRLSLGHGATRDRHRTLGASAIQPIHRRHCHRGFRLPPRPFYCRQRAAATLI